MKKLLSIFGISLLAISLSAQLRLNVDGDAKITGRLEIGTGILAQNTFTGYQSGISNTTGTNNTFYGFESGYSNSTGDNNTFVGRSAGTGNQTGVENVFVGHVAGRDNSTGQGNTYIGTFAAFTVTNGQYLTAFGYNAGASLVGDVSLETELNKSREDQQQQITELRSLVEQLLARKQESNGVNTYTLNLEQKAMLAQNLPNPFQQQTVINYCIPSNVENALIQVTAADGKIVASVKIAETGNGQINIKTETYPAGTYFYSLLLDGKLFETKRMVLTR